MPELELEADPGSLGERGALELMHGVLRALASATTIDDGRKHAGACDRFQERTGFEVSKPIISFIKITE